MRFTAVAAAVFAGLVAAQDVSTVYSTEEVTITSCAPSVTNCPASSGVAAQSTPAPAPIVTPSGVAPIYSAPPAPEVTTPAAVAPVYPAPEVTTIWSTVSYCTYSVTPVVSTVTPPPPPPPVPTPIGVPHKPSSVAPVASSTPTVYSGAGALSGSIGFAGAAAVAAFILA